MAISLYHIHSGLFNIAMENFPFTDDLILPLKPPFIVDFP